MLHSPSKHSSPVMIILPHVSHFLSPHAKIAFFAFMFFSSLFFVLVRVSMFKVCNIFYRLSRMFDRKKKKRRPRVSPGALEPLRSMVESLFHARNSPFSVFYGSLRASWPPDRTS